MAMKYFFTFLAVIIVILVLDVIWLKFVASGVFKNELGEMVLDTPRLVPAAIFYVGYAIGVMIFVAIPNEASSWQHTLMLGALLGLMAYGTYDLTNMATLKPWTWKLAGMDMTWGTVVTALSAVAGRKVLTLFT